MAELVYYCTKENNTCPKREECKRYIESDDKECITTLYKVACTDNNEYVLFMDCKKAGEQCQ